MNNKRSRKIKLLYPHLQSSHCMGLYYSTQQSKVDVTCKKNGVFDYPCRLELEEMGGDRGGSEGTGDGVSTKFNRQVTPMIVLTGPEEQSSTELLLSGSSVTQHSQSPSLSVSPLASQASSQQRIATTAIIDELLVKEGKLDQCLYDIGNTGEEDNPINLPSTSREELHDHPLVVVPKEDKEETVLRFPTADSKPRSLSCPERSLGGRNRMKLIQHSTVIHEEMVKIFIIIILWDDNCIYIIHIWTYIRRTMHDTVYLRCSKHVHSHRVLVMLRESLKLKMLVKDP